MDKQKLKKVLFIIVCLFIIIQLFSYLLYVGGGYFQSQNARSRAQKLYTLSYWTSLMLNQQAKTLSNTVTVVSQMEVPLLPEEKLYEIDNSKVQILGKRTVKNMSDFGSQIFLTAILKNTAEVGIPNITITKIIIYDKNKNVVARNDDYNKVISIPYGGEYPFTFELLFEKNNPELLKSNDFADFDIELNIPSFRVSKKAVRLEITDLSQISIESDDSDGLKYFRLKYRMNLVNNTDKVVSNIRRLSFFKHNDTTLTKMEDVCCTQVGFNNSSGQVENIINLSKEKETYILNPHEKRPYEFEMITEAALYDKKINPKDIQLVIFVTGAQ